MKKSLVQTQRLLRIVGELRRKCPWDKKQTHRSLVKYLLEEAYETADAIESGKRDLMREELGDLLLQVALHAEISDQKGSFSFEDIAQSIADKMVRRHPHIYAKAKAGNAKKHAKTWTELKAKEKPNRTLLEGTPRSLPSLQLAQRYGEIASSVGFDWDKVDGVWAKVEEELAELKAELGKPKIDRQAAALELGDLFFTLSNLARHLKLDAEAAARDSNRKFAQRFEQMEKESRAAGKRLTECSPQELEASWDRAKKSGRKKGLASRK